MKLTSKHITQKERLKSAVDLGGSSVEKIIQKKRKSDEESQTQQACIKWFQHQFPQYNFLLFAIPNGTNAGGKRIKYKGKEIPLAAIKAKKEGLKSGVADLFISLPHLGFEEKHGLYIEMKKKGEDQDPNQILFQKAVEDKGYQYSICRSLDEFIKVINNYLQPF